MFQRFASLHILTTRIALAAAPFFLTLSCGSGQADNEAAASAAAGRFARSYFNFRYPAAMADATPESRRALEMCASQMTHRIIDSLVNMSDTPTIAIDHVDFATDSEATCRLNVEGGVSLDTLGGYPAATSSKRSYDILLKKREGKWLVSLGAPLREATMKR